MEVQTSQKAFLTPTRWQILDEDTWKINDGETPQEFDKRTKALKDTFDGYVQAYGKPVVICYGKNDLRILWSKEIKVETLKRGVLSPSGTQYDCPLCQPYDEWNGYRVEERRFLCKVIDPTYPQQMEKAGGTWKKCPCLKQRPSRNRHSESV